MIQPDLAQPGLFLDPPAVAAVPHAAEGAVLFRRTVSLMPGQRLTLPTLQRHRREPFVVSLSATAPVRVSGGWSHSGAGDVRARVNAAGTLLALTLTCGQRPASVAVTVEA